MVIDSIMEGFSDTNEKGEGKFIEREKLQAGMKRLELEKTKRERLCSGSCLGYTNNIIIILLLSITTITIIKQII